MSTQTKRGFEQWATERHRAGLPYTSVNTKVGSDGRVSSTAADFRGLDWLGLGGIAGAVAPFLAGGAVGTSAAGPMSMVPATQSTVPLALSAATAGSVGTGAAGMAGWLGKVNQIAPLALTGASMFAKGDRSAQEQMQRQNAIAEQMQRLQLSRLQQSEPLYQAILQLAMKLMPKGGGV